MIWSSCLFYAALVLLMAAVLFPLYWLVVASLKMPRDAFAIPPVWIFEPTLALTVAGSLIMLPLIVLGLLRARPSAFVKRLAREKGLDPHTPRGLKNVTETF